MEKVQPVVCRCGAVLLWSFVKVSLALRESGDEDCTSQTHPIPQRNHSGADCEHSSVAQPAKESYSFPFTTPKLPGRVPETTFLLGGVVQNPLVEIRLP